MTIKKKIVVWYTIWMALLVAITAIALFSGSGILLRREIVEDLEEAVHDALSDIGYSDGRIWLDDMEFYDDGIYLSIWRDGELYAGRLPEGVPPAAFDDGAVQKLSGAEGEWYVFDLSAWGDIMIRGAARSYDLGAFASSMQIMTLLILPMIVLLAAFGGWLIVRRSFMPADRVIATAGDIAESNDLSKRIGLGEGSDEIHQMATAFDIMLTRIEEAFEKEKQFTSDASHELRTPISVIMAETEYASGHTDDPKKMQEALDVISRQAGKMSRLVSELLLLARSDKGTLQLHPERFDISELGEMVLSTMEDRAAAKDISLSLKAPEGLFVSADQDMIMRAMINLVSNAISYGHAGGWAIMRIASDGGYATVSVEDNGIGIAPEHMGKVWDRFYQADLSRTTDSSSGAGLGLSIVREIVEAHHGRVTVESIEGQGSTFSFAIPLSSG